MSATPSIRIGTRGSALALAQVAQVVAALERTGRSATTVLIETEGDRRAPDTAWGEGAFVSGIEEALLSGVVDVAVHSAKDVPTEEDPRLRIGAYLPRADPHDALVLAAGSDGRSLAQLPPGSRVGTDSPRRTGFLRALRPDLDVHPLHGNVDTRLRRLDDGATDALILAIAGLSRLGRADRISEVLNESEVPPAPGQGAIAIQVRSDDIDLIRVGAAIDDIDTHRAVEAERDVLRRSGGGCRAPIGALATMDGDRITILGGYAMPDGSAVAIERVEGPYAERIALVDELVDRLAGSVPGVAVRPARRTPSGPVPARIDPARPGPSDLRVLLTRPAGQAQALVDALAAHGAESIVVPAIEIAPLPPAVLDGALRDLERYAWVVVTSANGVSAILAALRRTQIDPAAVRWAVVGQATAGALGDRGITDVWLPTAASAERIAAELPVTEGDRVLLARAQIGDPGLPAGLRARGAIVDELAVYRTIEGPDASRPVLRDALRGERIDAVLFASGSAVRGLLSLAEPGDADLVRAIPAICIGPGTADVATEHGFHVLGASTMQRADTLAERTIELLRPIPGGSR